MIQIRTPNNIKTLRCPATIVVSTSLPPLLLQPKQVRTHLRRINEQIPIAQKHASAAIRKVFFPQDVVGPEKVPRQRVCDAGVFGGEVP
jgi:hypothetical protein